MDVKGTSAIVTGGASGLGAATARLLREREVAVVVLDLDADKGNALAKEIGGVFCKADVQNTEEVIAAVDVALGLGPLRALVNCAGFGWACRTIGKDGTYASAHDLDVFSKVVGLNLIGTFNCMRLAATAISQTEPVNDDGERGAIVNTASAAALEGQTGQVAYAASKGGVVALTLPAARDLAPVGVRVNCIVPGIIDTPIYGSGEGAEAFKNKLKQDILFPKRLGVPEEFASMALELITNSYVNAAVIRLDGGLRLPPK